ncbi:MAG: EamA family transporter RarD [Sphingomonadales bacterium]
MDDHRRGLAFGLAAYLSWGFVPVFFKLLKTVPAPEIIAHRILWSVLFLSAILIAIGGLRGLAAVIRDRAVMRALLASALLIGVNWTIYVWAVVNGHLLAASLGYFLNPLLNIMLGVLVLKESLSRSQKIAIVLAAVGVVVAAAGALDQLWISLVLATSFALYGLIRKVTPVGAIAGLAVETALLAPLCLGWLIWQGMHGISAFGHDRPTDALLILSAVVTSVPMMFFAAAARRIPYSTLGVLQYVAPSIVFLLGIFVYGEPLRPAMLVAFVLIWAGLIVFTVDMVRRPRPAPAVVTE